MKPKFTRGPYKVIDRKRGPDGNQHARFWIGAGETKYRGPFEIAQITCQCGPFVEDHKKDDEVAKANAFLFGVAAEMYQELESLLYGTFIEGTENRDMNGLVHGVINQEQLTKAKQLLAKARGES